MSKKVQKILILFVILAVIGLLGWIVFSSNESELNDSGIETLNLDDGSGSIEPAITTTKPEDLTPAQPNILQQIVQKVEQKAAQVNDTLLTKPTVLLPVLFASQAPLANWDALHQEACEEASMIMAYHYYNDLGLSPSIMETEIQKQVDWQTQKGYGVDVTAAQVQTILNKYFSLESKLISNPTAKDIETALSADELVIVPAAGRLLGNPNFRAPGPVYHMLVIIGYDSKQQEFITNDPGTRNGAKYRYKYDVLLKAIHDWNGGDVVNGEKVIVVVNNPQN